MNIRLSILFLFTLIIVGCSSPQKLYDKGNYEKAYEKTLSQLEKDKTRKNKVLLNKSFSKMIDKKRDELKNIEDDFNYKDVSHNLDKYEDLEEHYNNGFQFLDDDNRSKFNSVLNDKNLLVDETYQEANALMALYDEEQRKNYAQNAFYFYELVQDHGDRLEYRNIDTELRNAFDAGTIIYNVSVDMNFDFGYQWEAERRFDDIEGTDGFLRVVFDQNKSIGDCIITCEFARLDEDKREDKSTNRFGKEVIDGYRSVVDSNGVTMQEPIYKTVEGEVITYVIRKQVSWDVQLEVERRNGNCNLDRRRFSHRIEDKVEQYDTRGDKRAIPTEYLNQNNENLASTDDMVDELLDLLYRDIYNYIY